MTLNRCAMVASILIAMAAALPAWGQGGLAPDYYVADIGVLSGSQVPWNYGFGLSSSGNYVVGGCIGKTGSLIDPSSYIPVGYVYNNGAAVAGSDPVKSKCGLGYRGAGRGRR